MPTGRVSLTYQRQVRCTLKTPHRDGTTRVVFEPVDFIARRAVLVRDQSAPWTVPLALQDFSIHFSMAAIRLTKPTGSVSLIFRACSAVSMPITSS